jgi:hypothetical protein
MTEREARDEIVTARCEELSLQAGVSIDSALGKLAEMMGHLFANEYQRGDDERIDAVQAIYREIEESEGNLGEVFR